MACVDPAQNVIAQSTPVFLTWTNRWNQWEYGHGIGNDQEMIQDFCELA